MTKNIKTKGYAAFDKTGVLKPWEFEHRAVGDNDILIEVKSASICHSDIRQMKGHWEPQQYPQVPGHEIVGIFYSSYHINYRLKNNVNSELKDI